MGHAQKFFRRRHRHRRPGGGGCGWEKSPWQKYSGWESVIPEMSVWFWGLGKLSGFIEMLVLMGNLPERSLGHVFLVQQIVKMRLIDIRVELGGNPAFQKCWGGSLLHFLAKGLPKHLNI